MRRGHYQADGHWRVIWSNRSAVSGISTSQRLRIALQDLRRIGPRRRPCRRAHGSRRSRPPLSSCCRKSRACRPPCRRRRHDRARRTPSSVSKTLKATPEGTAVRRPRRLLGLAWIGPHEQHPVVAEAHVGALRFSGQQLFQKVVPRNPLKTNERRLDVRTPRSASSGRR